MTSDSITADMKIQRRGTSLTLTITKIVRVLGMNEGDIVTVTIKKKGDDDGTESD